MERALTKLSAFENDSDNLLEIKLGKPTKYLREVQNSIKNETVIQIDYLVGSRNELSTRKIEPDKIFTAEGNWYVHAYCKNSLDKKTFRLDRIKDIRIQEEARETKLADHSLGKDFFKK